MRQLLLSVSAPGPTATAGSSSCQPRLLAPLGLGCGSPFMESCVCDLHQGVQQQRHCGRCRRPRVLHLPSALPNWARTCLSNVSRSMLSSCSLFLSSLCVADPRRGSLKPPTRFWTGTHPPHVSASTFPTPPWHPPQWRIFCFDEGVLRLGNISLHGWLLGHLYYPTIQRPWWKTTWTVW